MTCYKIACLEDRIRELEAANEDLSKRFEAVISHEPEPEPEPEPDQYDLIVSGSPDEMAGDIFTYFKGISRGLKAVFVRESLEFHRRYNIESSRNEERCQAYMKTNVFQDLRQRNRRSWESILDKLDNFQDFGSNPYPVIVFAKVLSGTGKRCMAMDVEWFLGCQE